ncbi:MAG: hypothetical protein ABEH65_11355 [Halobacteriales archaeon]
MSSVWVWTYPWTLAAEGMETACGELSAAGIDGLTVASQYHSVQTLQPRTPETLFQSYPGGCYFSPDEAAFTDTPIKPPTNAIEGYDDPLRAVQTAADREGLSTAAWIVCLHNSRLGAEYPAYRIESAFGDAHTHAFCPSHSAVKSYYAAVVETLAGYGVDRIDLEWIGFGNAFHDHGWRFGHRKQQAVTDYSTVILLSQCFCDGCQAAADRRGFDLDRARERVKALCRDALQGPDRSLSDMDTLRGAEPAIDRLLAFRAEIVEEFLDTLVGASGSTPVNYYLTEDLGKSPLSIDAAGVEFETLESKLDRVTVLCYTSDPLEAKQRVRVLDRRLSIPVDGALTLDPDIIDSMTGFQRLARSLRTVAADIHVFNHGLMTADHLDWLDEAVG